MKNSLKIRTFKPQMNLYYYMVANAGQSTPQCVSKLMVLYQATWNGHKYIMERQGH